MLLVPHNPPPPSLPLTLGPPIRASKKVVTCRHSSTRQQQEVGETNDTLNIVFSVKRYFMSLW